MSRGPGILDAALSFGLDAGHCAVMDGIQLEAMNFFSDTQETAARFGDYIDDLHDVFRCNDVDFGGPEDFFAFARTLKYHSELRGDVLRVVKSVMDGETNVAFRTILTIIAVASGGPDVATSDREMRVPIGLVIESLIGVGAYNRLNADRPEGLYSDLTVKEAAPTPALDSFSPDGEATGDTGEAAEDTEGEEPGQILAPDGYSSGGGEAAGYAGVPGHAGVQETSSEKATSDSSVDSSIDSSIDSSVDSSVKEGLLSSQSPPNGYSGPSNGHQGPLNDFGGSNTLAESLTRLELNSLQLKIYLDSIDQRISRMEPRLEKVAPLVLSAPALHTREEGGARFSAARPAATIPEETEPQLARTDPPVASQQDSAATAGRVANGSPAVVASRRRIALPILVGVAMLLVAAFLFWRFGRDTGYVVVHPVNASVEGGGNAAAASLAPKAAASVSNPPVASAGGPPVAAAGGPSSAAVSGTPGKSSASGYTGQGASRLADKPTPSSKKTGQVPLRSPLRPTSSLAAPTMAKDAAEVTDPSDDADDLSSVPVSNRLVNVSAGVMAANLVSAPQPSYPTLASLTRTQGNVVMEAVISKDGTVEQLHVIKGHRLLRGAAKNAVRNWRYRPYKIGGVPVDVATTVSVDFSLHH